VTADLYQQIRPVSIGGHPSDIVVHTRRQDQHISFGDFEISGGSVNFDFPGTNTLDLQAGMPMLQNICVFRVLLIAGIYEHQFTGHIRYLKWQ
jgi:hypothetical protein